MYSGASSSDIYSGASSMPALNQWNHLVWQRRGGRGQMYVNGTRVYDAVYSADFGTVQSGFRVGSSSYYTTRYSTTGYISDFRVVKGTGVYNGATITVPTSPMGLTSGTELLLKGTDAGIYDLAGKDNIKTVGNAQIDTAVKKYGTGSLEFDGSGDYLEAPYNKAYAFSGDFTVEFWIYYISHVGSYTGIICCANTHTGSGAPTAGWILSFYSTGDDLLWEIAGQGGFTSTSSLSKNQWVHLAVVRSGSTVTLYMDGVSVGSKTQSGTADSVSFPLFVGRGRSTVSTPYFEGYIDDIRITNGIARYTSSFTPPDAALPKF